jgi:hypothetical protein
MLSRVHKIYRWYQETLPNIMMYLILCYTLKFAMGWNHLYIPCETMGDMHFSVLNCHTMK